MTRSNRKNEELKLVDSGAGFERKGLDALATFLIPENQATLMRWLEGPRNYDHIRHLCETIAQDERSQARRMTALGPAVVLAPIGQNWTMGPEGHRQVRGEHWDQDQNNWGSAAVANEEGDGWVNRLDGRKGMERKRTRKFLRVLSTVEPRECESMECERTRKLDAWGEGATQRTRRRR